MRARTANIANIVLKKAGNAEFANRNRRSSRGLESSAEAAKF
jgi:hypothetical protein